MVLWIRIDIADNESKHTQRALSKHGHTHRLSKEPCTNRASRTFRHCVVLMVYVWEIQKEKDRIWKMRQFVNMLQIFLSKVCQLWSKCSNYFNHHKYHSQLMLHVIFFWVFPRFSLLRFARNSLKNVQICTVMGTVILSSWIMRYPKSTVLKTASLPITFSSWVKSNENPNFRLKLKSQKMSPVLWQGHRRTGWHSKWRPRDRKSVRETEGTCGQWALSYTNLYYTF